MAKKTGLVLFFLCIGLGTQCFAEDRGKIVGTWKLVSYETEYQTTGEREVSSMGKCLTGYNIFTPEGRFTMLVTDELRKVATTDQDRADLWKTMLAFSGTYQLECDRIFLTVDVSSTPSYIGDQIRFYKFEGNKLQIFTGWRDETVHPERGKNRTVVTWERDI